MNHLFGGGSPLPRPFDTCGNDVTPDALSCNRFDACGTTEDDVAHEMTLYATADNVFIYDSVDASFGQSVFAHNTLAVGCDFGFSFFGPQTRCYYTALKFDVNVNSGRRIRTATLKLYPANAPADANTTYAVNALDNEWAPSTLRLTNAPLFFQDREGNAAAPATENAPVAFDVTSIVEAWTDGQWRNNGFVLRDLSDRHPGFATTRTTEFESTDVHSNPSRRPQLVIEYE